MRSNLRSASSPRPSTSEDKTSSDQSESSPEKHVKRILTASVDNINLSFSSETSVLTMGYREYAGSRAETHQFCSWFKLESLANCIRSMRKINYSFVSQRTQQLSALNALNDEAPFSET